MNRQLVLVLFLVVFGFGSPRTFAQQKTEDFVTLETGELPIILSAPHGGRAKIPGAAERTGRNVRSFKSKSDFNTDRFTEQLADAIEKKLGKRPYLVIARFHRKYVDANRPAGDAYESEPAKVPYETYHAALAQARFDVMERWGRGILFDIHGQSAKPHAVIRGTQNGKTTSHLIDRFGRESLTGEQSLFGQLAKQEMFVIPETDSTDREHPNYNGGYIVRTYGSQEGGTLDAIQIELGWELRSEKLLPTTVSKLANAVTAFAEEYLPAQEREGQLQTTESQTQKIRVGVYCDTGAGSSSKDLLKVLQKFEDVSVQKLMAEEIRSGACNDLDVLIQPGGSGGSQGRHLGEDGREQIRSFIEGGGGYIGICAGAYLASADYSWSLNILDAKVLDRKHWARGKGMVELTLTKTGQNVLNCQEQQITILYAQGPLLAPHDHPDIVDYEEVATFKTEIAKNGAPSGVMKGTTAIARGEFGRGRVFCFSPHPELTNGLESLVLHAIKDVTQKRGSTKKPETSLAP